MPAPQGRKNPLKDPRWTPWNTYRSEGGPYRPGQFGFSFRSGDIRADIYPVQGDATRLTYWAAKVWRGSTSLPLRDGAPALTQLEADSPWDLAELVVLEASTK